MIRTIPSLYSSVVFIAGVMAAFASFNDRMELGISMAALSRQLKFSISGVSLAVKRGEKIARDKDLKIIDS